MMLSTNPNTHIPMRQGIQCALIAFVIFALDVMTKKWAMTHISPKEMLEVTSFFNLVLTLNYGVSFSMFTANHIHGVYALIGLTGLLSCVVLYYVFTVQTFMERMAFSMVFAGAIGNLFDRIRLGGVVDFIDIHVAGYHWPAFNIADSAICFGVSLLFLYYFVLQKNKSNQK